MVGDSIRYPVLSTTTGTPCLNVCVAFSSNLRACGVPVVESTVLYTRAGRLTVGAAIKGNSLGLTLYNKGRCASLRSVFKEFVFRCLGHAVRPFAVFLEVEKVVLFRDLHEDNVSHNVGAVFSMSLCGVSFRNSWDFFHHSKAKKVQAR